MLSYCEAVVFLSVQRPLAPDHACFIVYLKQILGLLVHAWSFQLVDHLTCEDLV